MINRIGDTRFFIGFNVFPGIGPVRFGLLVKYFGSVQSAWEAPAGRLRECGLGPRLVAEFDRFRKSFDVEEYARRLDALRVSVLTLEDPRYPALLKEIPDAPFVLYVKGQKPSVPMDLSRTVGVVGTRRVTRYGEEMTRKITSDLVEAGVTIVSGLAYGVDAVAHRTAFEQGGNTIAVLGCGIDIIAPAVNAGLYHRITGGHGAVVSEMPLGLRPGKGLFPARNRIISGLSLGVVVTEGADDSGALITARNAAEQGRDVFAVPGPVTSPYSRGPLRLIKNGARLVESAADILEELGLSGAGAKGHESSKRTYAPATAEEQKLLEILTGQRMHVDDMVRASGLTMQVAGATLTVLEMKGVLKDYGEKIYGLVS